MAEPRNKKRIPTSVLGNNISDKRRRGTPKEKLKENLRGNYTNN